MTDAKKKTKPKTYPATINGRKVRVSIPDDPRLEKILADAIRDCLSPRAVALAASTLMIAQSGPCRDAKAREEVMWLANHLVELLGGPGAYNRMIDEMGL